MNYTLVTDDAAAYIALPPHAFTRNKIQIINVLVIPAGQTALSLPLQLAMPDRWNLYILRKQHPTVASEAITVGV